MDGNLIGILAMQGAFAKHELAIRKLGVATLQVRYLEELQQCSGLIIPGGESTVITRQILEMGLLEPLKQFSQNKPVFGTCAGMILMAREGILSLLDITVERNAYGRQRDSFSSMLDFQGKPLKALFIRAPRITSIHSPQVAVLIENKGEPVCVQQGLHLAASFHPELTNDLRMHKYFIELCKAKQSPLQPSKTTLTRSFQMI